MKNIFKLSLILLIAVFTFSCEDLLVEDPPSSISLSSFYQSESDALAGLYGAYGLMYNVMGRNPIYYGELNADNLTISPIVSDGIAWDEFTYNSDVTGGLWSGSFSGINRANEVILYTDVSLIICESLLISSAASVNSDLISSITTSFS